MIKHNILFIDLDTHNAFTQVGYIEDQLCEDLHRKDVAEKEEKTSLLSGLARKYPKGYY